MGQVLSAYGTILAINLFFVIVRVLLNINIKFVNMDGWALTADFLTQILKSIIVIAGCLLIEKFAKEIGGYFGAEDAMGAGKDMAKQVGDTAMKGVKLAAGVATGGAGLMIGAGKAVGGIAGKVGSGAKKVGGGIKNFAGGVKDAYSSGSGVGDGLKKAGRQALSGTFGAAGHKIVGTTKGAVNSIRAHKVDAKQSKLDKLNAKYQGYEDKQKELQTQYDSLSESEKNTNAGRALKKQIDKYAGKAMGSYKEGTKRDKLNDYISNHQIDDKQRESANNFNDSVSSAKTKVGNTLGKAGSKIAGNLGVGTMHVAGMVAGLGNEGKKLFPGNKLIGDLTKSHDDGMKYLGPEFEQLVTNREDNKKKRREDTTHKMFGGAIEYANRGGAEETLRHLEEMSERHYGDMLEEGKKYYKNMLELYKQYEDQGNKAEATGVIDSYVQKMNGMGASIDFSSIKSMIDSGKTETDVTLQVLGSGMPDKDGLKKLLDSELKNLGKDISSATTKDLETAVKNAMKNLGDAGFKKDMRALEKMFEEIMNKLK